jgi:hypothetical protein
VTHAIGALDQSMLMARLAIGSDSAQVVLENNLYHTSTYSGQEDEQRIKHWLKEGSNSKQSLTYTVTKQVLVVKYETLAMSLPSMLAFI